MCRAPVCMFVLRTQILNCIVLLRIRRSKQCRGTQHVQGTCAHVCNKELSTAMCFSEYAGAVHRHASCAGHLCAFLLIFNCIVLLRISGSSTETCIMLRVIVILSAQKSEAGTGTSPDASNTKVWGLKDSVLWFQAQIIMIFSALKELGRNQLVTRCKYNQSVGWKGRHALVLGAKNNDFQRT